ncbi:MAG TPA: DUF1800 family protein [Verrucomicrobiae bacterium]
MNTRRTLGWLLLLCLGAGHIQSLAAAEANPPPPSIVSTVTSNGQARFSFPYPGAERYDVFGAPNVTAPFTTNVAGALVGPTFTPATNAGPTGFYRVSVTPMNSNALFAATVLNRLTYGPSPADVEHIAGIGPDAFILEQMKPENIGETIDTDPPITNTPPPVPPPPPLTNWIRVSASGLTSGTRTNILIYLSEAGQVYLDDVRVVLGNTADVGPNLLENGDFENGQFSPPWTAQSPFGGSIITNSPTPDGLGASGTNCLLLIGTARGSSLADSFWAPFATNAPSAQRYTLSFSYLPVQNLNNITLTVRLSGSLTEADVALPAPPGGPPPPPPAPPAISPIYAKLTNTLATLDDLRAWHVLHAVRSQRQLHEVLVQFFDNHFCTQYQKTKDWFDNNYSGAVTNDTDRARLALDFDWREHRKWREALLNANCTFYDLLKISGESPAMTIYLDTVLNTKAAANENYGRELMELHTMGVDNGYLQQDIVEMAKVWTGWRVDKKAPQFANDVLAPPVADRTNDVGVWVLHFATNAHNYAVKKLFTNNLGLIDARFGPPWAGTGYSLTITNRGGLAGGTNDVYLVLNHLANLPFSAEFISVKLCRLFIHEGFDFGANVDYTLPNLTPEVQLVKACMMAWNTPAPGDGRKGNIRQVLNVIFSSSLFRGNAASQQKVKTPLELAVSAIRALRISDTDTNGYFTTTCDTDGYGVTGNNNTSPLSRMGGMGLFNKAEPDGYSEFGRIWLNTANLCERMRFVQHLLQPTSSSLKSSDYSSPGLKNTSDPAKLIRLKLPSSSLNDPAAIVDYFLGILYPGEGKGNLGLDRQAAINYLTTDDAGNPAAFNLASNDGRLRGMVALLMCLPRFQEQ